MDEHDAIAVSVEAGLDGDFRGRTRGRNVTVLSREGWEAACKATGIKTGFHVTRHTFASNFVMRGGSISDVDLCAVAGKHRLVSPDDKLIQAARSVKTCFGD